VQGDLECPIGEARRAAPQLLGLLSYWDVVKTFPKLIVPKALVLELSSFWSTLADDPDAPPWTKQQLEVGRRAEAYTVAWLGQITGDSTRIAWPALETDELGWDVEDHSQNPYNRIEVKGSRGREVHFILSDHELRQARLHKDRYEVHFWGRIDLARPAQEEYDILVNLGYPTRWPNFAEFVDNGHFTLTASDWRVTLSTESENPFETDRPS